MGDVRNIKQVGIVWETAAAKDYTVEVSDDGVNYLTAAVVEDAGDGSRRCDTISLNKTVKGRYVKINGTARTTDYGYSIYDMAVYGIENGSGEETTSELPTEETTTSPEITKPAGEKVPMETVPEGGRPVETTPAETTKKNVTTKAPETKVKVAKTKVRKASKKKTSIKAKIWLKKIKGVKGYQVKISTTKKFKKSKTVTKIYKKSKIIFKSRKIKNKKKLYVKARAYKVVNRRKCFGAWSKVKKMSIKK